VAQSHQIYKGLSGFSYGFGQDASSTKRDALLSVRNKNTRISAGFDDGDGGSGDGLASVSC